MSEPTEKRTLIVDDTAYETQYTGKFLRRKPWVAPDPRRMTAHIPGIVLKIYVEVGQRVRWGDRVLVLEAMKMKNDLTAAHDGVVKAIPVEAGQMVAKGQLLVELE